MSEKKEEKTLAQMLDEDKGFIASRRLLMTLSILFLVTVFGGVTIKEANTFIFKLEFLKPGALGWILCVAVFFCTIRYYAFATPYHKIIRSIWKGKLLADVMSFRPLNDEVHALSLISHSIREGISSIKSEAGAPHVGDPTYRLHSWFKREVRFPLYEGDEDGVITYYVSINLIDGRWRFKQKCELFIIELKYRAVVIFRHREYLDVLFPYWVALAAMLSYFIAPHFINDSTQSVLTSFQLLCHPLDA